jgi:phospholipid transport system substrate-binding protein
MKTSISSTTSSTIRRILSPTAASATIPKIRTAIRRMTTLARPLARRRLLGGALALALVALAGWQAARAEPSAEEARELIQTVGTEVLGVLRDDALSNEQKFDQLVALLSEPIDLDLVARLILGRYWRTASEAQRAEYLELFRAFALHTLASRLDVYGGQDFEITGARVVGREDALVSSRILSDGPPLAVDWRVRELDDGSLVAIDVIVEGVSLIVTQRSEFGAVVERRGLDGLLAELRRRAEVRA